MSVDTGGPAFPQGAVTDDLGNTHPLYGGMTLRDWFAGQSLPGVATLVTIAEVKAVDGQDITERHIAETAYAIADAMLAERAKGGAR